MPGVSGVQYVSKQDVLDTYRGYMQDYSSLWDEFETDNPFKANYRDTLSDLTQMERMSVKMQAIPGVVSVTAPVEMTNVFVEIQKAVTKGGRMIGKSMQALEVNRKLDKMRVSISKHYQEIMDRDNFVTADKVKNAFLGLEYRCHTLMKVYSQSRDEMEKQYKAGIKSLSSFTRYRIGCAYVGEFLQSHYHVKDIALKELSLIHI